MTDDFFCISPRIICGGKTNTISIKARYEQYDLAAYDEIEVVLFPVQGYVPLGKKTVSNKHFFVSSHTDPADKSRLIVEIPPIAEGEFTLAVYCLTENGKKHNFIFKAGFYALDEDLFRKRPFRGDMHVHSSWSECGRRFDDPRYTAVKARETGLDFMALTDHVQMEPSFAAQKFLETIPTDFLLIQGEECHLLGEKQETLFCRNRFLTENHIVNVGASQGVVRYANEHFDEYWNTIRANAEKLDHTLPEDVRIGMAGSDWIFDKIHEFGGMAIFCHPFWRPGYIHNLPDPVRDYIVKQHKYDAMEVIGLGTENSPGYYEGNALCISLWNECCMQAGRVIPLVGNTDSHNSDELPGKQYTIVFSDECTAPSLTGAIKQGSCVAVRDYDCDCTPFVVGSLRLSSYAYFLLREYFPMHDELCAVEGKMLRSAMRGECAATELPQGRQWQKKLFKRFFG